MTALPPAAQRLLELPTAAFLEAIAPWSALEVDDAMWMRCREDRALFASVFFGELLPLPFNAVHFEFLRRPKTPWTERRRATYRADAAPRGSAKSTIQSKIELVHDAVYGIEAFVGIVAVDYTLSEKLVKFLYTVFTKPKLFEELHRVYGPFEVSGSQTQFVVHVPGQRAAGCAFQAYSFGGTIRGDNHNGVRFTKLLLDDSEHPEKVRSPAQRAKHWQYLQDDIMEAGDYFTSFNAVGTLLHTDATLTKLVAEKSRWEGKVWQSIIRWPTNMESWDRIKATWQDLTLGGAAERFEIAEMTYLANKAKLDEGAVVLWPEKEDLFTLMVKWWSNPSSFQREKQNNPVDPTRQVYDPDTFARCTFDGVTITSAEGRRVKVRDCTMAVWLDPRASEEIERNDYAAIAVVAKDPVGYVYVLYVDMQRDGSDAQRKRMWGWFERFPRARYGYENNGFQALIGKSFSRERNERKAKGLPWTMSPKGHRSKENKNDRMISLEPDVLNRWVQFAVSLPQEALEQFRDIPSGTHDDAPDAVERAIWLVRGGDMPSIGDLR